MLRPLNTIFFLVVLFVTIAFFWLKFTLVDEVIRADGIIEPEGKVQTVQSRFQSVVDTLNVVVGDRVQKGDVLLTLNDEESKAQLEENLSSISSLQAEIVRLKAEVELQGDIIWPFEAPESLRLTQESLFQAKRYNVIKRIELLGEEAKLVEATILQANLRIDGVRRLIVLKLQEEDIYRPLVEDGAEPKIRLLTINQELQALENQIAEQKALIEEGKIQLVRNTKQQEEVWSNYQAESLNELATKEIELDVIKTKTEVLRERVYANELLSPVAGVVTKVMPPGPGVVVKSGEPILELVPLSSKIMIKANLPPQHINAVKAGQIARVNLTAYDFTTYGSLSGVVHSVAQNTASNESGEVFYNMWIECRSPKLSKSEVEPEIVPGMLVQVQLTGEKRSILEYLLQPIKESGSKAFTEKS
tara:strand:+ start:2574 stop:3827 length:1254 start_codon:yes stop_codon:yes gene_type:complete